MHLCPMVNPGVPPIPHVGGPILDRAPTVLTGMLQARHRSVRAWDRLDIIVKGSTTCLVCSLPAARILDQTAHGGVIILGEFTVLIGG